MTERQILSSRPLLARKGLAVPAGLPHPDDASPRPRRRTELGREVSTGIPARHSEAGPAPLPCPETTSAQGMEIAPAASLLPFEFLGGAGPSFDPARLPGTEPGETLAASGAPPAAPPAAAADLPGPEAASARVDIPCANPAWRIVGNRRSAKPNGGRALTALTAALALAAVLGAGWHVHRAGWLDFGTLVVEVTDLPNATVAEMTPAETSAAPQNMFQRAAPAGTRMPDAPEQAPPSVDVARVEPDGAAVLAGRAAPGAELILLDNGTPIGTVTADASGEWVFVPVSPLRAGAHQFGLVVKTVQGRVTLPAVENGGPDAEGLAPKDTEPDSAGSEQRSKALSE